MARYDGKLTPAEESSIDAAELLQLLGAQSAVSASERQEAIIRYLSGDTDWRDALNVLGGAFADERAGTDRSQRLNGDKEG